MGMRHLNTYCTNYPDGTARVGTTITIKSSNKQYAFKGKEVILTHHQYITKTKCN